MSLVLDALSRVNRTDPKTGSVGVTISSYRQPRHRRLGLLPLVFGLVVGGTFVLGFWSHTRDAATPSAAVAAHNLVASPSSPKGGAALPPPLILGTLPNEDAAVTTVSKSAVPPRRSAAAPQVPAIVLETPPALVLQAISERNSYPIAVINERLVKEGDMMGGIRVLKIGSDSVDVLLANGHRDTVRFAPPPEASPSPDFRF